MYYLYFFVLLAVNWRVNLSPHDYTYPTVPFPQKPFSCHVLRHKHSLSYQFSYVQYSKVDDTHFTVNAEVEISEQFFGWLFGLGKMVRIVGPESVRQQMQKALLDLGARYEEEAQQEKGQ